MQEIGQFYSLISEDWKKGLAEVSLESLANQEKTNYMLWHQMTNQVNIQAFILKFMGQVKGAEHQQTSVMAKFYKTEGLGCLERLYGHTKLEQQQLAISLSS